MNTIKTVIGDSDALIALYVENDSNHNRATKISERLYGDGVKVIFPNTAIVEAITTFQRKFSNPELAMRLNKKYKQGEFHIEYIDEGMMKMAADMFEPFRSKQNTFFDAIVAVTAKLRFADAIFSFDEWYTKMGFKLLSKV